MSVTGDLNGLNPKLLAALEALSKKIGEPVYVTSGSRTYAEQAVLWANRGSNPYPVAEPGTSNHESADAADVTINGVAIQDAVSADVLASVGLDPLEGDAVHVDIGSGGAAGGGELPPGVEVKNPITDAPRNAAEALGEGALDIAKGIVSLLIDAFGKDGLRMLLYVVLVLGGTGAVLFGTSRALGGAGNRQAVAA